MKLKTSQESCRAQSQEATGTTRLDVLVAVTMSMVLGGLLSTGWADVRTSQGTAECFSNQRELIRAMLRYATDNENVIVPTEGNPGGGIWPLIEQVGTGMSRVEARDQMIVNLTQSPLYPYLSHPGVFHCPDDVRAQRLLPGRGWAYDSYSKVNPMNGAGWQGSTSESGPQPYFTRIDEIGQPADTLAFLEEADPRGRNFGPWVMNVAPAPGWVDVVGTFHGAFTVFSFVDGHVERREWTDHTLIQAANNAINGQNSFFLAGGNARNPDFRWIHNRYRHKAWVPLTAP